MRRYVAMGAAAVALTYFLDPENGASRRRRIREWLAASSPQDGDLAAPSGDASPIREAPEPLGPETWEPVMREPVPAVRVPAPTVPEPPVAEPTPSVAATPAAEEAASPLVVAERPDDATLPPPLPADVLRAPEPVGGEAEHAEGRPRKSRWPWAVAAALALSALLAASGIAAWSLDLTGSSDDEATTSAQALAALTRRQSRAISIMAQPGATRLPVVGAEERLLLIVGVEGDAVLIVSRLDRAPAGQAYEIWVISGKTPKPAGLFRGGRDTVIPLTRTVPKGATVALTLERAGGVPRPTSKPIYVVSRS